MSFALDETIAAIATARQPGFSRGVIRVSGPSALNVAQSCFDPSTPLSPDSITGTRIIEGTISSPQLAGPVTAKLLVWPVTSYTNQPAIEIHTTGSLPVLETLLDEICRHGARLAEPGEFTMRAFLSGRLDLTEAEAVLGVIDADNKLELQNALQQLSGGLHQPLDRVRNDLIHLLANLEAGLDFVEEDIEFITAQEQTTQLQQAIAVIEQIADQLDSRGDQQTLNTVVLHGPPNAGKSTLFNALVDLNALVDSSREGDVGLRRPKAIVSDISGTTRDYVTANVRLHGVDLILIDTAGTENAADNPVPLDIALQQGQSAGQQMKSSAHLLLYCVPPTERLDEQNKLGDFPPEKTMICLTKSDLRPAEKSPASNAFETALKAGYSILALSAETGEGLAALTQRLSQFFSDRGSTETVAGTAVRCRQSIRSALVALNDAIEATVGGMGGEIVAAEVRIALDEIGRVTGKVYTDDILDVVFGQFCIGK